MKLIIDIPKNEYMEIKRYYDSLPEYSTVEAETYYIAHGTPLDDVIEKIRAEQEKYSHPLEIEHAMEILDNIGKADMRGE